jgi:hypothetical protein
MSAVPEIKPARPIDPDMERGRLAAEAVKAAGGSAMDAALAWIETTFDETAHQNTLRRRAERLRELQSQPPAPRPHRTVCIIDSLPQRHV